MRPVTREGLLRQLEDVLEEPPDSVAHRTQHALNKLLDGADGRVVLFGAGNLGRRTLACLRTIGVEPLAFTDNNEGLWGTDVAGLQVLSPEQTAERFADALFIVTIWNPSHWFEKSRGRLERLGCSRISPPSPIYWRFPNEFLPFYAQDLPSRVYEQASDVLAAAAVWSDAQSRQEFMRQVLWRARGEWAFLEPADDDRESYFLARAFGLSTNEVFVDCGAFDGDTLRAFLSRSNGEFTRYVAIEPDPTSFDTLEQFVGSLPSKIRERVDVLNCGVGAERGSVSFDATGGFGSKAANAGTISVRLVPINDLAQPETPVTFVKMDIEGAEADALAGGQSLIERDGPLLAVCVYHTQYDLWTLPLLLKRMLPKHHMLLRCHEGDGWQTVAYAVPEARILAGALS
jgi:FkbM family methyltransferase